jgi:predicted acyl esterase
VEANTPSADWVVRVFAVRPKGLALPLVQGIYRDQAEPNRMHRITVDLGSVAASVQPGEKLRVEIAGSNFPLYDRNLHTGEGPFSAKALKAHQKVSHRPESASRIELPVNTNERR